MICFPLEEYLSSIAKIVPLANNEFSTSMSSLEDKFLTNLAVMLSGAGIPVLEDAITVFVSVLAMTLL